MKQELEQAIAEACKELFQVDTAVELTRTDEQFGDYATNVALQLAKALGKPPREIAQALADHVKGSTSHILEVAVAGPGFVNVKLTDQALWGLSAQLPEQVWAGKQVVAEYSDPNPFKVLHAGHLYTSVVGDAIANLLEIAGATVHRVNFGGDVGLHVGRTMYIILQRLGGENPDKLSEIPEAERSEWLAAAYVEGTEAYEGDEAVKTEIITLNKRVYKLHAENDHDSPFAQIYWTTRQWSYDYFDKFYAQIGSHFEKYYPESETVELGLKTVQEHIGTVFEKSDGAIVFRGEAHGLFTQVFINSEGLPTYSAKDLGLVMAKKRDYDFDRSVIITGNEQQQYMAVVLKALEQFAPDLAQATTHLTHGMVKLAGGVKMSSRKGNILRAVDILDIAGEANKSATGKDDQTVVLAAVKYAFLKNRLGGDIIYDPNESVALEGNSGPYLQYAYARARSILTKAKTVNSQQLAADSLGEGERSLLRKISEYTEVVDRAVGELMPHHVTTYLYELAQAFNHFYEHNRVIGDAREVLRLQLVQAYAGTLKNGLHLLNITAPEHM